MTTVVLDILKKKVFSDSRMTIVNGSGKVIGYKEDNKKIFKSECGKFVVGISGTQGLTFHKKGLTSLGIEVNVEKEITGYNKGDTSDILIMNKYNNQVMHLRLTKTDLRVERKIKYYSGSTRLVMGSGHPLAGKVWDVTKDAYKAIRFAALCDKYTNGVVQEVVL